MHTKTELWHGIDDLTGKVIRCEQWQFTGRYDFDSQAGFHYFHCDTLIGIVHENNGEWWIDSPYCNHWAGTARIERAWVYVGFESVKAAERRLLDGYAEFCQLAVRSAA